MINWIAEAGSATSQTIQQIPNADPPRIKSQQTLIKMTQSKDSPFHKLDSAAQKLPAGGF